MRKTVAVEGRQDGRWFVDNGGFEWDDKPMPISFAVGRDDIIGVARYLERGPDGEITAELVMNDKYEWLMEFDPNTSEPYLDYDLVVYCTDAHFNRTDNGNFNVHHAQIRQVNLVLFPGFPKGVVV